MGGDAAIIVGADRALKTDVGVNFARGKNIFLIITQPKNQSQLTTRVF